MTRRYTFSVILMALWIIMSVSLTNCLALLPATEPQPPTPTPLPRGTTVFDPRRLSTETKAIEATIVNCSGRVPAWESAIVITEPTALKAITTTILSATSTAPLMDLPAVPQRPCYLIGLYFYNRDDVQLRSGTGGRWLIGSVVYNYRAGIILVERQRGQEIEQERYSVNAALLETLQREFVRQGVLPPP